MEEGRLAVGEWLVYRLAMSDGSVEFVNFPATMDQDESASYVQAFMDQREDGVKVLRTSRVQATVRTFRMGTLRLCIP